MGDCTRASLGRPAFQKSGKFPSNPEVPFLFKNQTFWPHALWSTISPTPPTEAGGEGSNPHSAHSHLYGIKLLLSHSLPPFLQQYNGGNNNTNFMELLGEFNDVIHLKYLGRDFPDGAVVKNPPANAGDMGLSPGPGRSYMPQSN